MATVRRRRSATLVKNDQVSSRIWLDSYHLHPSNGEAPVVDESLINQIHPEVEKIASPIWEPYTFYKRFTGKKSSEKVYSGFINDKKESFTQKLSVFIRGNFFIPDARKFWIKPGS